MIIVWLKFIISALVIFAAGSRLTKLGDEIADKTGLCKAWLGLVLLAVVTSLPELATAISGALSNLPDMVVGDIFGACMINIFFLAILDFSQKKRLWLDSSASNLVSTQYGVLIISFGFLGLLFVNKLFGLQFFHVSIFSLIIFLIYFLAQKALFSKRHDGRLGEGKLEFRVIASFLAMAALVVLAGSWLPFIGSEIVEIMGWQSSFVAVLFLGIATTLPELTVSVSALRIGQVGMAVGNLIGSNIFNVAILFVADLFMSSSSILMAASSSLIWAALAASVLITMFYVAMKQRLTSRLPSIVIILVYVLSLYLLSQVT